MRKRIVAATSEDGRKPSVDLREILNAIRQRVRARSVLRPTAGFDMEGVPDRRRRANEKLRDLLSMANDRRRARLSRRRCFRRGGRSVRPAQKVRLWPAVEPIDPTAPALVSRVRLSIAPIGVSLMASSVGHPHVVAARVNAFDSNTWQPIQFYLYPDGKAVNAVAGGEIFEIPYLTRAACLRAAR